MNMECTLHVFENIAPNAKEKPAISNHARAAQMYGNVWMLVRLESSPRNMTLVYVNIQPIMIRLLR